MAVRAGWACVLTLAVALLAGCAGDAASVLAIETPAEHQDADVFVDGEYIGQVDQVSGQLRLAPGTHRVEIRKPGHFPVQRTVKVATRETPAQTTVEAEMLPDPR